MVVSFSRNKYRYNYERKPYYSFQVLENSKIKNDGIADHVVK